MDIESITQLVGNLGFPIAVTAYVLIKLNKTIESMTAVVQELVNNLKEDK